MRRSTKRVVVDSDEESDSDIEFVAETAPPPQLPAQGAAPQVPPRRLASTTAQPRRRTKLKVIKPGAASASSRSKAKTVTVVRTKAATAPPQPAASHTRSRGAPAGTAAPAAGLARRSRASAATRAPSTMQRRLGGGKPRLEARQHSSAPVVTDPRRRAIAAKLAARRATAASTASNASASVGAAFAARPLSVGGGAKPTKLVSALSAVLAAKSQPRQAATQKRKRASMTVTGPGARPGGTATPTVTKRSRGDAAAPAQATASAGGAKPAAGASNAVTNRRRRMQRPPPGSVPAPRKKPQRRPTARTPPSAPGKARRLPTAPKDVRSEIGKFSMSLFADVCHWLPTASDASNEKRMPAHLRLTKVPLQFRSPEQYVGPPL